MLSTLVTFDIENETGVARSSLSSVIEAFFDKTSPRKVTIRTAQCVSRKMTRVYEYET